MGRRGNGEGSITRHKKSGLYMARYWVESPTGPKRKTIYGKKREDVAEKLADALSERNKGIVLDDENITVAEYLDRWLKDCVRGSVRESTFSRDKYLVTNHVKPSIGRLKLKNLNALRLQGLYRERLDSGLSGQRSRKFTTFCTRRSPRLCSGALYLAILPMPSRLLSPRQRRCTRCLPKKRVVS